MRRIGFLLVSILVLFEFKLFAKDDSCSDETINAKENEKCECCGCDIRKAPTIQAYNAPARIDVCGSKNTYISGSFLYWQTLEQGLYVVLVQNASRQQSINIKRDFDLGFKLGLGYNLHHDDWSIFLEYTRFHTHMSFDATRPSWASTQSFYWITSNDVANEYLTNFKMKLDILDLELSRWEYRGKKLVFNPFCGIKGSFLDQEFNFRANFDTSFIQNNLQSESWLIGPRVGFYAKWMVSKCFSIKSKASASLNYQKFHDMEASLLNTTFDDDSTIAPICELLLGCNFNNYFSNSHMYFDFFIGYEAQVLWNQNILYKNRNLSVNSNVNAGELTLHGLNASLKFDF